MTLDKYLEICSKSGLSVQDLEYFTIGSSIDYMLELHEGSSETRKASQADFDAF